MNMSDGQLAHISHGNHYHHSLTQFSSMVEGIFLKILYHNSRRLTHLKKYIIIPDIDFLSFSSDIYTKWLNCIVEVLDISFIVAGTLTFGQNVKKSSATLQ